MHIICGRTSASEGFIRKALQVGSDDELDYISSYTHRFRGPFSLEFINDMKGDIEKYMNMTVETSMNHERASELYEKKRRAIACAIKNEGGEK